MKLITSRDNQKLKYVRKVRDGKISDSIFIEGKRLVKETIRSQIDISDVFVSEEFWKKNQDHQIFQYLTKKDINLVSSGLLRSISDTINPQGIILICRKPTFEIKNFFSLEKNKVPLFILLHRINNPNNFGAICRTAEAAGILGIISTTLSASAFSPKTLRASMGSVLRVPIWENAEFEDILNLSQQNNLKTTCADINSAKSYFEIDWKKPRLLVFGSEAHGLTASEREKISEDLIIPMENNVESLNLAVSCGIILFEAKKQFNFK